MNLPKAGRILTLLSMVAASSAFADAPLQVTLSADEFDGVCDAHCSLRDAIEAANRATGSQSILLPAGEYRLSRPSQPDESGFPGDEDDNLDGDLDVRGELIIQGQGSQNTTIIGGTDSRLLEVLAGGELALLRLTLKRGRTAHNGGALENHGELLLREVNLTGNQATTPHPIASPPPVEEAFDWGQGGAIANYGNLSVFASTFKANRSEALYYNDNLGRGGAIFNMGNLLVRDSLFDANRADDQADRGYGGAIYSRGSADIARSLFADNQRGEGGGGGAIFNTERGTLKLANSTLSGNAGAAVYNGHENENAPSDAVAVAVLVNVTIAESDGSGLGNTGDILVRNSLIVANYDPYDTDTPFDCITRGDNARFHAIGLLTTSPTSTCNADLYADPERVFPHLLAPLADNGGFTKTYALRPGSMAVDAGIGSCSGHDQRRQPRPQDGTGNGVAGCDLGAFERTGP